MFPEARWKYTELGNAMEAEENGTVKIIPLELKSIAE